MLTHITQLMDPRDRSRQLALHLVHFATPDFRCTHLSRFHLKSRSPVF